MIIGLSGTLAGGKDTVSEYLIKKGWQHISLSDILRREMKKKKLAINRDSLREYSNQLAKEKGGDYLAKVALKNISKNNVILSSVRKPGEVDFLKRRSDFKLLFIDAPIKLRYQRIINRAREGDSSLSFKKFSSQENQEMSGGSSQVLSYCKNNADKIIDNSKDLKHLYKQIEEVLNAKKIYKKIH